MDLKAVVGFRWGGVDYDADDTIDVSTWSSREVARLLKKAPVVAVPSGGSSLPPAMCLALRSGAAGIPLSAAGSAQASFTEIYNGPDEFGEGAAVNVDGAALSGGKLQMPGGLYGVQWEITVARLSGDAVPAGSRLTVELYNGGDRSPMRYIAGTLGSIGGHNNGGYLGFYIPEDWAPGDLYFMVGGLIAPDGSQLTTTVDVTAFALVEKRA